MGLRERVNQLLNGEGEIIFSPFSGSMEKKRTFCGNICRKYRRQIFMRSVWKAVRIRNSQREGWWKDMDVILDEAGKRNMKVWILDDEHFPTGYAAGAMEHADKELCHQYLDYNVLESWGPRAQMEIRVSDYAKPQPLPPWMPSMPGEPARKHHDDRLFRVLACPVEEKGKIGKPVDLTEKIEEGDVCFGMCPQDTGRYM